MEADRPTKAEDEVAGPKPWIIIGDILPLARASSLPDQCDYLSMRASVHVGANGLMPDHVAHDRAPMPPSPPITEYELALIDGVAARDRQAFETLYHRYAPVVYRYLWKFIRQREIVEETLNDVMMVVWETASRFNGTSRLSTWILGIAHNKALKARARSARSDAQLREAQPDGAECSGPEDVVAQQELASSMARALDNLRPEQRAVVELTFYHDRSYAEIAEIVGCPVNTVKTRMLRARKHLASLFAAESIDHDQKKERG
jgi:RNA polymerase sigma factor (sigma-70 family)